MKITHICLGSFFVDNYSYQENLLTKYHKKLGHDVEVITSLMTFDKNGKASFLNQGSIYQNEYDIKVTRLDYKKPVKFYGKFRRHIGFEDVLKESKPDILFIHNCQFLDMDIIVRYLREKNDVKVYVDNHADFTNSATNWISKNVIHKIIWKHQAKIIEPYVAKFYGVLPVRVDFLINAYGLPKEKCELLVMGADDELVEKASHAEVKEQIRNKYNIDKDDFLIVTGGKIDQWKTETLELMKAVHEIDNKRVKLLVFGSVVNELKVKLNELCDGEKVQYIGWIQADESYNYFGAADLVVFPGRHSVFWEQVVAQRIPIICRFLDGTTHVNVNGNCRFLYEGTVEEIGACIEDLIRGSGEYNQMKNNAQYAGKHFLYSEISKKSIK